MPYLFLLTRSTSQAQFWKCNFNQICSLTLSHICSCVLYNSQMFCKCSHKIWKQFMPILPPTSIVQYSIFFRITCCDHHCLATQQLCQSRIASRNSHVRKIPRKTVFHMEAQNPSQESLPLITFFPSSGFYIPTHRMFYLWYSCKRQKQFKCCSAK